MEVEINASPIVHRFSKMLLSERAIGRAMHDLRIKKVRNAGIGREVLRDQSRVHASPPLTTTDDHSDGRVIACSLLYELDMVFVHGRISTVRQRIVRRHEPVVNEVVPREGVKVGQFAPRLFRNISDTATAAEQEERITLPFPTKIIQGMNSVVDMSILNPSANHLRNSEMPIVEVRQVPLADTAQRVRQLRMKFLKSEGEV